MLSGIGNDWAAIESEVGIIRSSAVGERVVKRLKLDQQKAPPVKPASFFSSLLDLALSREKRASPVNEDNRISYLGRAYSSAIGVERINDTYILSISYQHANPRFSASVANAFADEYLVDQLSRSPHPSQYL